MAVQMRVAGVLPLVGAAVAATALAGVATFAVSQAGCADAGHYVQHSDGQLELVGSCLDPADLPAAPPGSRQAPAPVEPAVNYVGELNRQVSP